MQRGKAAKLKKVKQKYADQDEEDRALAMAALASAGELADPKPSILKTQAKHTLHQQLAKGRWPVLGVDIMCLAAELAGFRDASPYHAATSHLNLTCAKLKPLRPSLDIHAVGRTDWVCSRPPPSAASA